MIARSHRLAADACFILLVLLTVACNPPASYEQFVRADEAPEGIYEFTLPDFCTAPAATFCHSERSACHSERSEGISFDLSFYTAPLSAPMQLEVAWSYPQDEGVVARYSETVWFPASKHRALYRNSITVPTGDASAPALSVIPSEAKAPVIIRVKPINPPERFRGLGIICKRHDGTR